MDLLLSMELDGAPAATSGSPGEAQAVPEATAQKKKVAAAPHDEPPDDGVDQEEEDAHEMLMITGAKDGGGEKVRFERKAVLLAYAGVALQAGIEVFPAHGFGAKSPSGPYCAYVTSGEAKIFRDACEGKLTVRGPDGEMYELDVKMILGDQDQGPTASRAVVKKMAVHIVAHLDQGRMFRCVRKRHLKQAFKDNGFVVFSASQRREHVVDGDDGVATEDVHLNIRPRDGTFVKAKWPALVPVPAKTSRFSDYVHTFFVRYEIKPHDELPAALFCLVHKQEKVDGKCPGCEPPKKTGKGDGPPTKKVKRTADEIQNAIIDAAAEAGTISKSREELANELCPRYLAGKCFYVRVNGKCPKKHPEDVPPSTIKCSQGKTKYSLKCNNGNRCLYNCSQMEKELVPGTTPDKSAPPGGKRRMVERGVVVRK